MNIQKNDKQNATITGIFFILAAISSIIGLKLYDPILAETDFITSSHQHHHAIVWGAINELILCITATGTGLMMYPYLKKYNESLGLGYLSFRMLEVVFIMMGIVAVLAVLSISQHYANHAIDKPTATALGLAFIEFHDWTFMLGPNFMLAINTFIYSYVFFQTRLLPKKLAILGLTSACLIMLAAMLEMFHIIEQISTLGVILAIPIALYEMSLAVYLIRKGFQIEENK
ncbi:hypothetical protein Emtol_2730 [Emticicia oligotrophica DSM 17448]|uniref:DUF4386 domain-containing protein n=1 Tax=Emticicia oligotrophica (strain DSM 17448 / CIP 109782 / MTCC 6937 / GPTSA100-15) TaxID=929562 RepID=A0ABN4APV5_EMTOG|nr:DUF4386 domain-containing protein [Emticicia oligotrophica]AFK03866.1 hypothetical protein Emtol_2730 [Emticicia oligotrophica DSM 17448]